MRHAVLERLAGASKTVIDLQRLLVAIPALGPQNGGHGERLKADALADWLAAAGFPPPREYNAPDSRVPCGHRPNQAVILPGADPSRTFWIISHLDIVPPGDLSLWRSDPYALHVEGDLVYGRGVEDNHQAVAASILLGQALLDLGITPPMNLGLLFVSDEETGSKYGLDYVVSKHPELFSPSDLFLVPDFGQPDGEMVEVAEKSMLWLKVTVIGRQCHASTPADGRNTLVAAADMILGIEGLKQRFPARNDLFSPPVSTIEPTRKDANVENVNTIPGKDVFYVDCRVLPEYDVDDVLSAIREVCREAAARREVEVAFDIVQKEPAAPPTPVEAEIVRRALTAIRDEFGNTPRPMGIGGGTVAAYLRRRGHQAVVWSCLEHNAHQPNERSSIAKTLADARVMARVLFFDQ